MTLKSGWRLSEQARVRRVAPCGVGGAPRTPRARRARAAGRSPPTGPRPSGSRAATSRTASGVSKACTSMRGRARVGELRRAAHLAVVVGGRVGEGRSPAPGEEGGGVWRARAPARSPSARAACRGRSSLDPVDGADDLDGRAHALDGPDRVETRRRAAPSARSTLRRRRPGGGAAGMCARRRRARRGRGFGRRRPLARRSCVPAAFFVERRLLAWRASSGAGRLPHLHVNGPAGSPPFAPRPVTGPVQSSARAKRRVKTALFAKCRYARFAITHQLGNRWRPWPKRGASDCRGALPALRAMLARFYDRPPPKNRATSYSWACPKNRVDTEVMLGHVTGAGHEVVADPAAADVIVRQPRAGSSARPSRSRSTPSWRWRSQKEHGSCQPTWWSPAACRSAYPKSCRRDARGRPLPRHRRGGPDRRGALAGRTDARSRGRDPALPLRRHLPPRLPLDGAAHRPT
jgi:hypothetical protein